MLSTKTVKELHLLCRNKQWKGYSRLRKADLIHFIEMKLEPPFITPYFHAGANLPLDVVLYILEHCDALTVVRLCASNMTYRTLLQKQLEDAKIHLACTLFEAPTLPLYMNVLAGKLVRIGSISLFNKLVDYAPHSTDLAKKMISRDFTQWTLFADDVLNDESVQVYLFHRNVSRCMRLMIERGIHITHLGWLTACAHNGNSVNYAHIGKYPVTDDMLYLAMTQNSRYASALGHYWECLDSPEKSQLAVKVVKYWYDNCTALNNNTIMLHIGRLMEYLSPKVEEDRIPYKYTVKEVRELMAHTDRDEDD